MKILFVITRMVRGGASRMALGVARRLHRRGHEVSFAAGLDDRGENSFWPELNQSDLTVHPLRHLTRPSGVRDGLALLELTRLMARVEPDCVHLHTSKAGTLGVLAARLTSVPRVVYSSHGHLFHESAEIEGVALDGLPYYVYYWLRRLTVGLSDRVVALSNQDKQEQVELGLGAPERFTVIPNGVSIEDIDPRPEKNQRKQLRGELDLPKSGTLIVSVGRLVREKGHDQLIKAMGCLGEAVPDPRLVIVGGGPRRDQWESLAGELGVDNRVHFVGPRTNVYDYLRCADLFCFPSFYESQGLALMEAMAVGLPCVSTDQGGLKELAHHGRTAHVVPPRSPGALAEGITRVVSDGEWARRLGQGAREWVEDNYSMSRLTDRTVACYESI